MKKTAPKLNLKNNFKKNKLQIKSGFKLDSSKSIKQNKFLFNNPVLSFDYILVGLACITLVLLIIFGGQSLRNFPKKAQLTVFEGVKTSYEIPVMLVLFIPDKDKNGEVDKEVGYSGYYNQLTKKAYTNTVTDLRLKLTDEAYEGAKFMTQASKYHGYKDPSSKPSITYNIRSNFIYESKEMPPLGKKDKNGKSLLDYNSMLSKFDICKLVEQSGIREVWVYAPSTDSIALTESNMSSKLVGDVSNSDRDESDLPICSKTYTVYTYDIKTGVEEMIYKRANQLQTLLTEWPKTTKLTEEVLQDSLYWGRFVGSNLNGDIINPGCGYVKKAPNINTDFDYFNTKSVNSTCENFEGDIKTTFTPVSCKNWSRYFYGNEDCKVDGGISYLIWWMQNIPGQNNYVFYKGSKVRNLWDYIGDIERVYKHNGFYMLAANEQNESIPTFNGNFDEKPFVAENDDHLYTHPLIIKPAKSTIEFPLDVEWAEVDSAYYYIVKLDLRDDGHDDIYEKKFSGGTHKIRIKESDLERKDNLYEGSIVDITIMARSAKYGDRAAGPVPYRVLSNRKMPRPQQVVVSTRENTSGGISKTPTSTKPTIAPTPRPVTSTGTSLPVTQTGKPTPSPIVTVTGTGVDSDKVINEDSNSSNSSTNEDDNKLLFDIWDFVYNILEKIFYDFPVAVIKFFFDLFGNESNK